MYSVIRHSRAEFEPKEFIFDNMIMKLIIVVTLNKRSHCFFVTSFNFIEPIKVAVTVKTGEGGVL